MKFNTSTLGYNLLSGKLISSRKNSEQLNKFLAGFIDSDGCFTMYYAKGRNGKFRGYLMMCITQTDINDPDHQMMIALRSYFNLGILSFHTKDKSSVCEWRLAKKETLILLNRLRKHLRIKGTHVENLLWLQEEISKVEFNEEQLEDLKCFSKYSRRNSTWEKRPKHPSWAWLAGYLAGDGHFRCRINRQVFDKRNNQLAYHNQLYVSATSSVEDGFILEFLQEHLGGKVCVIGGYPRWTKGLGKSTETQALDILKNLRKYMCLEKKYLIIERMIEFHEKNKSQRLSELGAKA